MSKSPPLHLTRFVGREREVAEVRRLLGETRLLTLTGAGGSGKTRLAIEVARQGSMAEDDGLIWVDLAPLADETLVAKAVVTAAAITEEPGRSATETLVEFLRERPLLLVLDNCEHLAAACAQLVNLLLQGCPDLQILATSREPLALPGERVYPVPPLSFPPAATAAEFARRGNITAADLQKLQAYEAVRLFLDRARAVVPVFELTPGNAGSIAAICRELDGMPLAIELAAAQINVLTADQIAERLDHRLALLASRVRSGVAQRHHTLRAAIDWSYELLSPADQMLLRRLSVFAGGCSLTAAEAVCSGEGIEQHQLLPLLSSLINQSLLTAETLGPGQARYALLETIRQYAAEKLDLSGEGTAVHDRHLHYYLQVAQETEAKLIGHDQERWLNRLAGEYDNLRAALSWSLETAQIEAGLRIAVCLYQFWTIRDYVEEGLDWSERLLDRADEAVPPAVRANALAYASILAGRRGETGRQERYADEAASLGEAAGDEGRLALALARGAQGWVAQKAGDHQQALALALEQARIYRDLADHYNLALALSIFSFSAMSLGEYDRARSMLEEALPLLRQAGNPYRIAMALNYMGDLARLEQDYVRAITAYEESIPLLRDVDAMRDLASALHNLGHAYLHGGDSQRARALFEESMALQQELQNKLGMAECLVGFAALAGATGSPATAARLLATAATSAGRHIKEEWAATRSEYDHYRAQAQAELSAAEFERQWATGERMSLEQGVALARDLSKQTATDRMTQEKLDALTPREREVAALVGQGMSNGAIAEQLVLSKRTVETHVSNIRSKLGFTSRGQMVRWAIESGLVA